MTWCGVIAENTTIWEEFPTLLLRDRGYELDLVGRLNEAAHNYGKLVAVRYWTSATEKSKDEMILGAVLRMAGSLRAEHLAEEYSYSEYTHGVEYSTSLKIDGHNLYNELLTHKGRYLLLEVDFHPNPLPCS